MYNESPAAVDNLLQFLSYSGATQARIWLKFVRSKLRLVRHIFVILKNVPAY